MVELFFKEIIFFIPQTFFLIFLIAALILFPTYGGFYRSVGIPLIAQCSYFFVLSFLLIFSFISAFPAFSFLFSSFYPSYFLLVYAFIIWVVGLISFLFYLTPTSEGYLAGYEVVLLFYLVLFSSLTLTLANDLLVFYLALEFQALSLYVLAASKVNSTYSTESGLKYFVLGSFASSLLLLGISLVYGVLGSLNLFDIYLLLEDTSGSVLTVSQFAFLLILIGLLFKVGVVPFHFWVPDVYAGVPLAIFAFFVLLPKLAAWAFCVKFVMTCLSSFTSVFSDLLILFSILSLIVGAYGAVTQSSIKRVLSYSAIGHSGFLLLSLSTFSNIGVTSNVFYLFIYVLSILPLVLTLFVLSLRGNSSVIFDDVTNVRFIYKFSPFLGAVFSISLFSLAGIPPFSGFFAKLYLFLSTISFGFYYVTVLALLVSVASAVYYLKLVRNVSVFKAFRSWMFLTEINRIIAYVITASVLLNILFFAFGGEILSSFIFINLSSFA